MTDDRLRNEPCESSTSMSSGSRKRLRETGSGWLALIPVVRDDSGRVDDGADVRRSVYERKERRLEAFILGDGEPDVG